MAKRRSSDPFFSRVNESMEENLRSSGPTIVASYRLVGSILFFGGGGYLLDRWLTTAPWFLVAGLLAGVAIGLFGLVRVVRR